MYNEGLYAIKQRNKQELINFLNIFFLTLKNV